MLLLVLFLYVLMEERVSEGSVGLSFLASLTRKSRLAAVGFVHMGEDGKMPPRSLLKAGV